MGHLFITFSDESRALAERARDALEAGGITTWLRDRPYNQDNFAEQKFLDAARYTATAFLVVWQPVSDSSAVPPAQLLQDIKEARDRGQPILHLRDETHLSELVLQVSRVVQPGHTAAPLPILLIEEDADTISDFVAQMRSPSRRIVVSLMVGGIGSVILMGLILIVQMPGGLLNPSIITATYTHTPTVLSTSTNVHTATGAAAAETSTAFNTDTATVTETSTSFSTDTATATGTATATSTATATGTATATHTVTATGTATATYTATALPTATPTPTLTITYTPTLTPMAALRPSAIPADIQGTATQRLRPAVSSPIALTPSVAPPSSTDSINMSLLTNTPRSKMSAQG